LTQQIAESFGARPLTYLAGRYGFGANTGGILEELGYQVDISPAVPIDFSADGGPDYSGYSSDPYWFGEKRKLLGLPGSGGYVGWLRAGGTALYQTVTSPGMRRIKVGAVCARLRAVERIRLSPEDYSEPEMRRLTDTLLRDGIRVFVFGFHSPSVMPGGAEYVRSGRPWTASWTMPTLFRILQKQLNGVTMTPIIRMCCERRHFDRQPYKHSGMRFAHGEMFYQLKDRVRRYRFAGECKGCPASAADDAGRVVSLVVLSQVQHGRAAACWP
jgi:hypothetical protein